MDRKVIARARCVGTVTRLEVRASRHGGYLALWTDVTRDFTLTMSRATFRQLALGLRPFGDYREDLTDSDAKRVMEKLIRQRVHIRWEHVLLDGDRLAWGGSVSGRAW